MNGWDRMLGENALLYHLLVFPSQGSFFFFCCCLFSLFCCCWSGVRWLMDGWIGYICSSRMRCVLSFLCIPESFFSQFFFSLLSNVVFFGCSHPYTRWAQTETDFVVSGQMRTKNPREYCHTISKNDNSYLLSTLAVWLVKSIP